MPILVPAVPAFGDFGTRRIVGYDEARRRGYDEARRRTPPGRPPDPRIADCADCPASVFSGKCHRPKSDRAAFASSASSGRHATISILIVAASAFTCKMAGFIAHAPEAKGLRFLGRASLHAGQERLRPVCRDFASRFPGRRFSCAHDVEVVKTRHAPRFLPLPFGLLPLPASL